jgi:hypothetical protein
MATVKVGNRAFRGNNQQIYLDNEIKNPVELDPNDAQDAVIIGTRARMTRDGDWEGLVQLQATSMLFQSKTSHKPEVIGKRQVYLLTKNGQQFEHRDPTTLQTMTDQGFEITGTMSEDIVN